jgi:hypothetical protein
MKDWTQSDAYKKTLDLSKMKDSSVDTRHNVDTCSAFVKEGITYV